MELANVRIGQKVTITEAALFYSWNVGKTGTVSDIEGDYITVDFGDDDDYGHSRALTLVVDVIVPSKDAENVKEAIANVEAALAVLKALVG